MTRVQKRVNKDEEWRSVVGFEGRYEVSSLGRVRSWVQSPRYPIVPRILRPGLNKLHLVVSLSPPKKGKTFFVHRLVARAFLGPCPPGMEASHEDGDGTNNCVSNLRWRTRSENQMLKRMHGTMVAGEMHPRAKLTEQQVLEIRQLATETALPHWAIAEIYGVHKGYVWKLVKGRARSHPVFSLILAWILVMTPVGMVAEASFDLEYQPGVSHSEGLRFLPEVIGMRTQPPPRYEPLRASGRATGAPITIRKPVDASLPPWSVVMCESRGSYTAENAHSTASGRYQFVDGTWNNYGGYSHASDAPPEVQDAKAREVWANGAGRGHWRQCL